MFLGRVASFKSLALMAITYTDIDAEWEKLSAQSLFPPEAEATMTAFMQHFAGLSIRARCIHCGELLTVTDLGSSASTVTCPCGRSKDTLRGLLR